MPLYLNSRSMNRFLSVPVLAFFVGTSALSIPAPTEATKTSSVTFQDLSQKPPTLKERAVLEAFAFLVNTGQLEGFLNGTVKVLKYTPKVGKTLREIPPETLELGLHIGAEAIRMLVQMQGEAHSHSQVTYLPWHHVSRWMDQRLNAQEKNRRTPVAQDISDPTFYEELLSLAETEGSLAREVEILVDGPASFVKRAKIIREAKTSIDILTWAVLDDDTGYELRDQLIQKHRQGVQVRLMVDGLVNLRHGYRQAVKDMAAAGIPVVRWRHKTIPFFGQHRKMMIVDGTYMIAGGLNPGNKYSHKKVTDDDKWRDTDIYATGDIVQKGNELFAKLWNEQGAEPRRPRQNLLRGGTIPMSLVELSPDIRRQTGSTIMLSTLKAIRGAQHSIDIENAYVILFPQLEKEIKKALARGVRVRILTNSDKSVDEPIISQPMMISAKRLAEMGAEIYLRQGSTLHSKFMIVDRRVVMIGSYNLHPRSERLEGEMVFIINDTRVADDFLRVFEKDIHPTIAQFKTAAQIQPKLSFLVKFTLRYFFDLL